MSYKNETQRPKKELDEALALYNSAVEASSLRDKTSAMYNTLKGREDDNVNHPKRYTKGKVECIDAIESAVIGKPPEEAVLVAAVIKYLFRYEAKGGLEDVLKSQWYLKRLITKMTKGEVPSE